MNIVPMEEFMPEYLFLNDKEVVEKIVDKFNMSEMDALKEFLSSQTYQMCTDINLSMWEFGSSDIFDMWIVEKITGNPRNINFMRTENQNE